MTVALFRPLDTAMLPYDGGPIQGPSQRELRHSLSLPWLAPALPVFVEWVGSPAWHGREGRWGRWFPAMALVTP
jgi:hypothetical protein